MTDKEISEFINSAHYSNHQIYSGCSILELRNIFNFFERKLKTSRGNWSKKQIVILKKELNFKYDLLHQLRLFYGEYSKRIKPVKTFELLIKNEYDLISQNKILARLELKKEFEIKDFLEAIKELKKKYLKGSDEQLLTLIDENLNTGYTKKTLRNYFYSS